MDHAEAAATLSDFLHAPVFSRTEVLAKVCPVPKQPGVYGWWFDRVPSAAINPAGCENRDGWTLLYVGISPSRPPRNGKPPSGQTIRRRIVNHCRGRAATSTLRLSLGCLLTNELGLQLRRAGTARRRHFGPGELVLNAWISEHARVSWIAHEEPWMIEDELISTLDLPLNLRGNETHAFHPTLSTARADARRQADDLWSRGVTW